MDAASCNNDAALKLLEAMNYMNGIASEYYKYVDGELWYKKLKELSDRDDKNPKLSGYSCEVLIEKNLIDNEKLSAEVSRRLSPGIDADLGDGWFEGLSMRNRYALLSRKILWEQLEQYVVTVIQQDAIQRKGLTQLLYEPEVLKNVKPDIQMVATLLSLRGKIPERTKNTARELVNEVVKEIMKRLESDIRSSVMGALNRKQHSPIPNVQRIDWKWTIGRNLKNYNKQLNKLIPEMVYYFEGGKKSRNWTVILDMDQSGFMADSIIYGSVAGSIHASKHACTQNPCSSF